MASRKEDKERLRQERIEREAADRDRKARQATARKIAAVALVIALIAGAGVAVALSGGGGGSDSGNGGIGDDGWPIGPAPAENVLAVDAPDREKAGIAAKAASCTIQTPPFEGRTHQEDDFDFKYKTNPPTSGDHVITPADDGPYQEAPTTPELVHSLEHGRVEFQWNPKKVSKPQIGTIKKLYDDEPYHLIITPNPSGMKYAIAATAWNRSLTCETYNDKVPEALRWFHVTYLDEGPENVP